MRYGEKIRYVRHTHALVGTDERMDLSARGGVCQMRAVWRVDRPWDADRNGACRVLDGPAQSECVCYSQRKGDSASRKEDCEQRVELLRSVSLLVIL